MYSAVRYFSLICTLYYNDGHLKLCLQEVAQLQKLREEYEKHHEEEISHHEDEIRDLEEQIKRHKDKIARHKAKVEDK